MRTVIDKMLGAAVLAGLLGTTGCQTYNQQNKGTPLWRAGNVPAAVKEFNAKAEKEKTGKDTVIWRLEQGTALRAAGQLHESNTAFEAARARIDEYEEKAKVRVGKEAGAAFSNQANVPYEGRDYDKILLHTYKALNYLQMGEFEKARPELIRAFQRQQDAVENNRKRIAKEQEEIAEAEQKEENQNAKSSVEKAREDDQFKGKLDETYAPLKNLKAYADYVNPFTVYLDAIYFTHLGVGGTDLERAHKSFERVLSLAETNDYVREDIADVDRLLRNERPEPVTYVLFETGNAPWRDQIRIDIPLFFIGSGNVPYAGAAFPVLKTDDNYLPSLTVTAGGTNRSTALIASIDSIVAQSFKDELPTIITKTLLSTTIKAATAYAMNKAAEQQDAMLGLFMKIATAATQAAMNIADTRTWTTLPKEVQACRVPTPADGTLVLSAPGGAQRAEVKVDPNSVNLILVKAINATSPLIVNQIKLKQNETLVTVQK